MKIFVQYAKANWLFVITGFYVVFSCILRITTGINITIPCLFKTLFNRSCPGCGLTHAFMELLKLNVARAWEHNPLIFLVIPAGIFFISRHFLKFRKRMIPSLKGRQAITKPLNGT